MNVRSDVVELFCPECGADIPPTAIRCWRCRRPFPNGPRAAGTVVLAKPAAENRDRRTKFQFTLASILLMMTFAAVLMSIIKMAPGLGIGLAILSAPALLRTVYVSMHKGSRGKPLSFGEKAGVFVAWLGLGLVVCISAGVAFFLSCFAVMASGKGGLDMLSTAFITGGIVGLLIAIILIVLLWRKIKI